MTPKVSVCITTYNHEKWIAQAIESVLCQQTTFPFEVLIGEDDSEDNTRKIVLDYANRHPTLIKVFLNNRKNVVYIDGFATGRWNFVNNLVNSQGEYIALLEGDDYWLDPLKLQKQVEMLDAHLEHAICFHAALIEESDGRLVRDYITKEFGTITTIHELANGNYIHTPTCMFRRKNVINIPQWFWKTRIGDYPIHLINARHGSIYKIPEAMAVYRNTGLGAHSSMSRFGKQEAWLQTLDILIREGGFDGEIKACFVKNIISNATSMITECLDKRDCAKIESLLAMVVKYDSIRAADAYTQYDNLRNSFARLINHPIVGSLITLLRILKRDSSFGRYENRTPE